MNDTDYYDYISSSDSECCGASLTNDGMCMECGEHAEPFEEEEE
jgi:hypothetical protein